jgi:hypothetical protein
MTLVVGQVGALKVGALKVGALKVPNVYDLSL